jgi:hypothetical protein
VTRPHRPGPLGQRARACLLWAAACAAGLPLPATANPALQQGRALFTGAQALPAQAGAAGLALPASASRCVNCHSAPGVPAAGTPGSASYGPALNSAWLLGLQPRRGGPPSRYDAAALCQLLRQGQDPAGVMLAAAMPRYTLSDTQCRALWTLLTSDL